MTLKEAPLPRAELTRDKPFVSLKDDLVIHLFERAAVESSDAVAVVEVTDDGDTDHHQVSYGQLNRMAGMVRDRLVQKRAGHEDMVVIDSASSIDALAALLGVWKGRACFLPVDSSWPKARIERVLREAGAPTVLVATENQRPYTALSANVLTFEECFHNSKHPALQYGVATGESAAYVIYTSGSTGEPKGVVATQKGILNHATSFIQLVGLTRADVVLQFATLAFDAAYEEIFPCLCAGARLVLRSKSMKDSASDFITKCEEEQVTVLDVPTAYWHMLTRLCRTSELTLPRAVRVMVIGGEQASREDVSYWREHFGHRISLFNTYGPTEATIIATAVELTGKKDMDAGEGEVPIGKCLPGVSISLLNGEKGVAHVSSGEIYISGLGVARGYLRSPRLTAERFVPNNDGRSYRTGDLAALGTSNGYVFKGRNDNQVKVNGYRVQLEEVERALLACPAIAACAVMLRNDWRGGKQLVAYCVLNREETSLPFEEDPLSTKDLRQSLAEMLPAYMVPAEFNFLEKFILTSNGKIDRASLPEIGYLDRTKRRLPAYQRPRRGLETRLAEVWCEVLDLEITEISVTDPFEYLGGNSLYSIQIRYKAQKAGLLFKAEDFHLRQTIRGLAEVTSEAAGPLERMKHISSDYASYLGNVRQLLGREVRDRLRPRWNPMEKGVLQKVDTFYRVLKNKQEIFYVFFDKNLLHWLLTTLSFVPADCNVVVIGSGLRADEVEFTRARIPRPFLHLPETVDMNLILDVLFEVNQQNFGWLDVDCFIMNPSIFKEMCVMPNDTAINTVWTHAACGPTKRPFHVLETYCLFFNIHVIRKLRAEGVVDRATATRPSRRQVEVLKRLIPGDREMKSRLDTFEGKALLHRFLNFEFDPLILFQLVANARGYKLNRVRFFTEIDSFNLHNYYSDEAIHVYPTIRGYDTWDRSDIDQQWRTATDYLLLLSRIESLPPSYRDRKSVLEDRIERFRLDIRLTRGRLREYLRFCGMTEKSFTRSEFQWLAEEGKDEQPQLVMQ